MFLRPCLEVEAFVGWYLSGSFESFPVGKGDWTLYFDQETLC
jgi:hypothetical protein